MTPFIQLYDRLQGAYDALYQAELLVSRLQAALAYEKLNKGFRWIVVGRPCVVVDVHLSNAKTPRAAAAQAARKAKRRGQDIDIDDLMVAGAGGAVWDVHGMVTL